MRLHSRLSTWVLLPILAGSPLWAAEPEIACRGLAQHRINVTVMGPDGSDPTVIFEGPKFKLGSTMPNWSPGGEWVALRRPTNPEDEQVSGIYRIRPNGEDLTQILCEVGTGRDDVPFRAPQDPRWSPDGQWILLRLYYGEWEEGDWLGIIRPSEQPDGSCHSDLIPLYTPDGWDPQGATGWRILGAPSWNHDGSKIAFFEEQFVDGQETGESRLNVLDIGDFDGTPTVTAPHPIELSVGLQEIMGGGMDWQRGGGNILLFDTNDGIDKIAWLDLDLETHQILDWGHLTEGWNANWSPNNDRIVYNLERELRVADVGYDPDGAPMVLDSSLIYPDRYVCLWADWQRDAITECGDGVCEGGESACSCSADCGPEPSFEDDCANGVDDDCDGLIDCADDDCEVFPACLCEPSETDCSDEIDNDCDTDVDCSDSDCDSDPICAPPPADCSQYTDKWSCNADPGCRWDNQAKECVPN